MLAKHAFVLLLPIEVAFAVLGVILRVKFQRFRKQQNDLQVGGEQAFRIHS
jgi:hypothetical protein